MENYGRFHSAFVILSILGKGGYGIVFKVKDKSDQKDYAIKRIDMTMEVEPEKLAERETKFKELDHRNIVKYYDFWHEHPPPQWQMEKDEEMFSSIAKREGIAISPDVISLEKQPKYLYIKMELCNKENLVHWLYGRSIDDRIGKYYLVFDQILKAVEYLHSRGLIHRDLKPANILFGLDGLIKIGDFSTVLEVKQQNESRDERELPKVGHTISVGTRSYRAPEIKTGTYDHRVDLYSLGVMLFEMITPMDTVMERASVIKELQKQKCYGCYKQRHLLSTDELALPVLIKMIKKNPDERPTIDAIKSALKRIDFYVCDVLTPYTNSTTDEYIRKNFTSSVPRRRIKKNFVYASIIAAIVLFQFLSVVLLYL